MTEGVVISGRRIVGALSALVSVIWLLLTAGIAVAADGDPARLAKAIELFSAKSYAKTIEGAEEVAASGVAHAPAILNALSRRRVYVNFETGAAAYRSGRAYFDFMTNKALEGRPKDAKSVRVNNRVRGAIKAALGTLQLRCKPIRKNASQPPRPKSSARRMFQMRCSALERFDPDKEPDNAREARPSIDTRAALLLILDKPERPKIP